MSECLGFEPKVDLSQVSGNIIDLYKFINLRRILNNHINCTCFVERIINSYLSFVEASHDTLHSVCINFEILLCFFNFQLTRIVHENGRLYSSLWIK